MAAPTNLSFELGAGGKPDGWTITVLSSGYDWAGYFRAENRFTHSEQLDNAAWTKTAATVNADAATAPPGFTGTTADELVEDNATSEHKLAQDLTGEAGTVVTASVYAKASSRDFVWIGEASDRAWFDLDLGTTGTTTGVAASCRSTRSMSWPYDRRRGGMRWLVRSKV